MEALMSILMDAFFIALLIWCGIMDVKKRIVPNAAIVLLLCLGIVHVCLMATSSTWWTYPAGLIFAVPYFIVWLKNGMGAGDVKLLIAVGFYLGLLNMLIALVLMIPILAALMLRSWVKTKTIRCRIPFAPAMAFGSVGAVLLGYLYVFISERGWTLVKTIISIGLCIFIVGALVFLRIRRRRRNK